MNVVIEVTDEFVYVDGKQYPRAGILTNKQELTLRVGDYVKVVDDYYDKTLQGQYGKIAQVNKETGDYSVDFPGFFNGHDCDGTFLEGNCHGQFVRPQEIVKCP